MPQRIEQYDRETSQSELFIQMAVPLVFNPGIIMQKVHHTKLWDLTHRS